MVWPILRLEVDVKEPDGTHKLVVCVREQSAAGTPSEKPKEHDGGEQ